MSFIAARFFSWWSNQQGAIPFRAPLIPPMVDFHPADFSDKDFG